MPQRRAGPRSRQLDPSNKHANVTLSNGNLTATLNTATTYASSYATGSGKSTGQYYFEVTLTSINPDKDGVGIANATEGTTGNYIAQTTNSVGWRYAGGPTYSIAMGGILLAVQNLTAGDTIAIAVDLTTKRMWVRSSSVTNWNNDVIGNQNPAVGSQVGGADFSAINAGPYWPYITQENTPCVYTANFGATAYAFAVPSGYSNWSCTKCLVGLPCREDKQNRNY
jgi:hypothetical protein